jgi:nucleotide-binding universal stress UspA family protein
VSETDAFARVLVALDTSPHSLAALEAAVELAALFDVELAGVFVEDRELLKLAELPLASEVASFSATIRPLDSSSMRLQLRAVAERARRALAASADRARVRWSFRVLQGGVPTAVMEGVGRRDLISLGSAGWSRRRRMRLGSTTRAILSKTHTSTLVLESGRRIGAPLFALYDGSNAARRGLDVVARLAREGEATVLIVEEDEGVADRLEGEAREQLRARGVRLSLRRLVAADRKAMLAIVQGVAPGLAIFPARAGDDVMDILAEIDAPILLVRDAD